ncbi:hypothetical protein OEB99_02365 [Actinotalea sp. M2MS4P-6]|uniref:hypothetical protein n=1 Tax=Actinotalea sp. M2MS4P-6 TaxID=2983762 RepID=UPI0021E3AEC2|nr:hypothetical protein [Actinotalea sp. M2MS4P-6]MCV2393142.1 hypothetical protein [Actinotalea sp. M2MS4P-6]
MEAVRGTGRAPGRTLWVVLGGYAVWVLTWFAAQLAAERWGEPGRTGSLLLFMVGFEALAGVVLALVIGRREGLLGHSEQVPFARTTADRTSGAARAAGLVAFAVALLVGLVGSGAVAGLVAAPPDAATVGKYLLLFPGMALAVTLHCFVLIPRAVERMVGPGRLGTSVAALAGALAVAVGFWVDQLLRDPALAAVQAGVGLAVAAGALLTRSVWGTSAIYFSIMLVNTLEEDRYGAFPWSALVVGAAAVGAGLLIGGMSRHHAPVMPVPVEPATP